jgi:hypothetical protein
MRVAADTDTKVQSTLALGVNMMIAGVDGAPRR